MKIIEQKENPLFGRKEIIVEVVSNVSPSNPEISKLISGKFSAPEDGVKVKGIYGSFGAHKFKVLANVYKSKEDKEKTERKTKKEIEAEKKLLEASKLGGEE